MKGYFIQYRFIIPESTKHSSYTYQKLFRALYGYTQNVTKSNGKTYHYHRKGVLSDIPYIRPGKNCVIIPPKSFNTLDTFFKTGKNPTHYWRAKGNWKAVFYMDEKEIDESQVISAIKEHINRIFQVEFDGVQLPSLGSLTEKTSKGETTSKEITTATLVEAEKIISTPWFKEVCAKDPALKKFNDDFKALKT